MRSIGWALCLLISLVACAGEPAELAGSDPPTTDPRLGEPVANLCFARAVNGFEAWDAGEGVVLRRGVSDEFLVTFRGRCRPADGAQLVGLSEGFAGSGCIGRGDFLYFSRSALGARNPTPFDQGFCRIDAVRPFARTEKPVDETP